MPVTDSSQKASSLEIFSSEHLVLKHDATDVKNASLLALHFGGVKTGECVARLCTPWLTMEHESFREEKERTQDSAQRGSYSFRPKPGRLVADAELVYRTRSVQRVKLCSSAMLALAPRRCVIVEIVS